MLQAPVAERDTLEHQEDVYAWWEGALALQQQCQRTDCELPSAGMRLLQQAASEMQTVTAANLQSCLRHQRVSPPHALDLITKKMRQPPQVHARCMLREQHTMAHRHETLVFLLWRA